MITGTKLKLILALIFVVGLTVYLFFREQKKQYAIRRRRDALRQLDQNTTLKIKVKQAERKQLKTEIANIEEDIEATRLETQSRVEALHGLPEDEKARLWTHFFPATGSGTGTATARKGRPGSR